MMGDQLDTFLGVEDGQWTARCREFGLKETGLTDVEAWSRLEEKLRAIASAYDQSQDSELSQEQYDLKTRLIESGWISYRDIGPRPGS